MGLSRDTTPSDAPISPALATSAAALYIQFGVQLLIGTVLGIQYSADPWKAHASTAALHQGLNGLIQGIHYWGSAVLIVHSVLHVAAMTWAGAYRPPHQVRYLVSLGMAALSIGFQLTGNLLPFDKHGVQTAAIEGGIANQIPAVGPTVGRVIMAGDGFTTATYQRWLSAHFILFPIILVTVLGIGYWAHRRLADVRENRRWAFLPVVAVVAVALLVASPLGSAATPEDYGQFSARVSWYTWPGHGALVLFNQLVKNGGWIGTALLPGLLAAGVLSLPLAGRRIPLAIVRGAIAITAVSTFALAMLYGGRPASLVGTRDPEEKQVAAPTGTPSTPRNDALAALGRKIFAREGCDGCHGTDGLKAKSGPSLAATYKKHPEPDYYRRYIKNPHDVNAESTMPAFDDLPAADLNALAEFLRFPRT